MSNDKIDQIWNEERDRIKNAANEETETEELSKSSLDAQIEELERDYDRYNRAAESNSGPQAWGRMAEDAREELIELKTQKLEELATEHDSLDHTSYIGAMRVKKRLNTEYHELEGEVEELQAGER